MEDQEDAFQSQTSVLEGRGMVHGTWIGSKGWERELAKIEQR